MEAAKKTISQVKQESGVNACVECGRCTAACPMTEMYVNFSIAMSPRGIIKKAMVKEDLVHDENLWYCTECNSGTDVCPQGVSCRNLIRGLRDIALGEGLGDRAQVCPSCGDRFVAVPVESFVLSRLADEAPRVHNLLKVCPSCRRDVYITRNA